MTDLPGSDLQSAVTRIAAALAATPKKARRILLKTLLNEFGFKVKSAERLHRMAEALGTAGVHLHPPLTEIGRDDWVTLSLIDPPIPIDQSVSGPTVPAYADDAWFEEVLIKTFSTEREVEIRFILPLLERLGYTEADRADGYAVSIVVGVKQTRAQADFVLFGDPREGKHAARDVLLVVEAKAAIKLRPDHVAQARSYAMFLNAPYYLLTNGDDIHVYLYRSPIEADVSVFSATRRELRDKFGELYQLISREAVQAYRQAWAELHSQHHTKTRA